VLPPSSRWLNMVQVDSVFHDGERFVCVCVYESSIASAQSSFVCRNENIMHDALEYYIMEQENYNF
jgi:hypothetical protein